MAGLSRKTTGTLRSVDSFTESEAEEMVRKTNSTNFDVGGSAPPPRGVDSRSIDAKRINECLKHFNAFCNTLAAGIIAAAAIVPFVKDADATVDANAAQWCAIAAGFHFFPWLLNFLVMQSEE